MPSQPSAEIRDWLALQLVPGLGPRLTAALLARFGSARGVLEASAAQLQEVPHIGAKTASGLHEAIRNVNIEGELEQVARFGVQVLRLGTPEYPATLATIPDPPHLLYVRGALSAADARAVAIVGSRQCTSYGVRIAERLGSGLARAGYTIVSGLARGIDGAAHRGALQAKGRTLAVLAGGLSKIYPPEHADLAREVEASGALLSEASMSMTPLAEMFPARNRLISGLSKGVIIVEAAERSGALITARLAGEQGRLVFAVPGPVDSLASAGTLKLLRDGATLIRGVEDVLEELEGMPALVEEAAPRAARAPTGLSAEEQRLWDLVAQQPRHFDELAQQLQIPAGRLSGMLLPLEMRGAIRRLPGNRFERA
jgi:DNA processing protein